MKRNIQYYHKWKWFEHILYPQNKCLRMLHTGVQNPFHQTLTALLKCLSENVEALYVEGDRRPAHKAYLQHSWMWAPLQMYACLVKTSEEGFQVYSADLHIWELPLKPTHQGTLEGGACMPPHMSMHKVFVHWGELPSKACQFALRTHTFAHISSTGFPTALQHQILLHWQSRQCGTISHWFTPVGISGTKSVFSWND